MIYFKTKRLRNDGRRAERKEKPTGKNSKVLKQDTSEDNEKRDAQHKRSGDISVRIMKALLINWTCLVLRVVEVVAVDVRNDRQGPHHHRGKSHRDDEDRKNFLHTLNLNIGGLVCQTIIT